jgi:pilus assembly protein CpaF
MKPIEWIISGILISGILIFLYYIFKEKVEEEENTEDIYSIDYLCIQVKKIMNEIINMDIDVLRLNKRDLESRKELKRTLSDATRGCSQGNSFMKRLVFARIKKALSGELGISEDKIDDVLPFQAQDQLSALDKFEILMYLQKRENNYFMFREISKQAGWDRLKKDGRGYYYDVTQEDVDRAYEKLYQALSYDDKLNIITQRVYEETYGLSVVDLMIMEDESIDSISGGVSGITTDNYKYREDDVFHGDIKKTKTFESVWIVLNGKPMHLKFLSFGSKATLVRVCKNLSEHGRIGHFTSSEGGNKNHLADGSRVTTFRPYNASQWAFFVRKFGTTRNDELKDLITDQGCDYPISLIRWFIKGCVNMIFSGDQNSGKTSGLRAAVREMDRRQQIRTIEADFELYLNDEYWDRNILGTKPSKDMSFEKLIELLKASEAHTILFGETASLEHARHLLNLLLAGTKRIITTGHWPTADELVSYFVLSLGGYGTSGTQDVEQLVSRLLHIDVHYVKDHDGHRYIDRITEIIPYEMEEKDTVNEHHHMDDPEGILPALEKIACKIDRLTKRKTYYTRDIIIYRDGEYHMINPVSDRLTGIILHNLPPEERALFLEFNQLPKGDEKKAC